MYESRTKHSLLFIIFIKEKAGNMDDLIIINNNYVFQKCMSTKISKKFAMITMS